MKVATPRNQAVGAGILLDRELLLKVASADAGSLRTFVMLPVFISAIDVSLYRGGAGSAYSATGTACSNGRS
jgi:hypothetical protein